MRTEAPSHLLDLQLTSALSRPLEYQSLPSSVPTRYLDVLNIDTQLVPQTITVHSMMIPAALTRLTPRGSVENTGLTMLSLFRILRCMPYISFLHLADVDFPRAPEVQDCNDEALEHLPTTVIFEGLPSHAPRDFFNLVAGKIKHLTFRRCHLWHDIDIDSATHLKIEQVTDGGSIMCIMSHAYASSLTLRACPTLDGHLFEQLAWPVIYIWDDLEKMIIHDCQGVAGGDIWKFMIARANFGYFEVERCGELTPADIAWLGKADIRGILHDLHTSIRLQVQCTCMSMCIYALLKSVEKYILSELCVSANV